MAARFYPLAMRRLARLWIRKAGQDLIEYAILAGFVAVTAGAMMPPVADAICSVISQVKSALGVTGQDNGGHHQGG